MNRWKDWENSIDNSLWKGFYSNICGNSLTVKNANVQFMLIDWKRRSTHTASFTTTFHVTQRALFTNTQVCSRFKARQKQLSEKRFSAQIRFIAVLGQNILLSQLTFSSVSYIWKCTVHVYTCEFNFDCSACLSTWIYNYFSHNACSCDISLSAQTPPVLANTPRRLPLRYLWLALAFLIVCQQDPRYLCPEQTWHAMFLMRPRKSPRGCNIFVGRKIRQGSRKEERKLNYQGRGDRAKDWLFHFERRRWSRGGGGWGGGAQWKIP